VSTIADLDVLVGFPRLALKSGQDDVLLAVGSWLRVGAENAAPTGDFKRVASCVKSV
jgi:hypothetical protein